MIYAFEQNIFIKQTEIIKLGDFGLTKILDTDKSKFTYTKIVGTPGYIAPEIYKGQNYGTSSDIWSLGCVLYELAELKPAVNK